MQRLWSDKSIQEKYMSPTLDSKYRQAPIVTSVLCCQNISCPELSSEVQTSTAGDIMQKGCEGSIDTGN